MFLRVSSLQCASHGEGNPCRRLPLPRPSTRCGVVNQQKKQVVEDGREAGWGRLGEVVPLPCNLPQPSQPPPTSLTSFSSHFAVRVGVVGVAGEEKQPCAPGGEPAGRTPGGGGPARGPCLTRPHTPTGARARQRPPAARREHD